MTETANNWIPKEHPQCRKMTRTEYMAWNWASGAANAIKKIPESERQGSTFSWILLRWQVDPISFAVEALRTKLMPYQATVLLDLSNAPLELYDFYECDPGKAKLQVLIPSGHGLGKTRTLAVAILWMLITHIFSHTLCTAPSANQLTGRLWSEIRKLFRRLKSAWPNIAEEWEILGSSIVNTNPIYGDWNVIARTARPEKPESLQGAHALDDDDADGQLARIFRKKEKKNKASGGILVVIEEASGVDDIIRKTLEGALSEDNARLIAPGNPTRPDGWFAMDIDKTDRYAVHTLDCRQSDRTKIYSLPWRDMAGITHKLTMNGFVSPKYWEHILEECDGNEDADYFRVRVKGQKPRSAFFSMIKINWVEEAQAREKDIGSLSEPVIIGLDFGLTTDKHGLAVRQGFNMLEGLEWLCKDDPELVTLQASNKAIEMQEFFNAGYIIGDSNGVGRGAMESLTLYFRERPLLKVKVIHFNSGTGAHDKNRYHRRRDEMWYKYGRKWIANPRCSLLKMPSLKSQLTAPQFSERNNVIYAESKKDLKSRGIKSTNIADSLLETLMVNTPERQAPHAEDQVVKIGLFEKHFKRLEDQKNKSGVIR